MSMEDIINARMKSYREEQLKRWRNTVPRGVSGYDINSILDKNSHYSNLSMISKGYVSQFINREIDKNFLILQGASGLGKTAIACSIVDELLKRAEVNTARYIEAPTMMMRLSYGTEDGGKPESVIRELCSPDILLIDDVGAGSTTLTPPRKMGIWSIINDRWANNKLTIITTNLATNTYNSDTIGLMDWFGEAAWDRISGNMVNVTFKGSSLRQKL